MKWKGQIFLIQHIMKSSVIIFFLPSRPYIQVALPFLPIIRRSDPLSGHGDATPERGGGAWKKEKRRKVEQEKKTKDKKQKKKDKNHDLSVNWPLMNPVCIIEVNKNKKNQLHKHPITDENSLKKFITTLWNAKDTSKDEFRSKHIHKYFLQLSLSSGLTCIVDKISISNYQVTTK